MRGQTKKKTLAQLRAEKEQSVQNLNLGREILQGVIAGLHRVNHMRLPGSDGELIYNEQSKLLVEANRAVELLQQHTYAHEDPYIRSLYMKAALHETMGHALTLAMPTLQKADEVYAALEREGFITSVSGHIWVQLLGKLGIHYLDSNQLEAAKRCFLKILASPRLLLPFSRDCPPRHGPILQGAQGLGQGDRMRHAGPH